MPSRSILDRLANGEHLLLDGGTGSEIQRRGADVLKGARAETGLEAWSATANIEFAEVVQQVHRDYLRVGADVILSNNFWTTKSRLEPIGLGDNWQEYARAAGENAIAARDRENPEAYVAGTFAPPSLQGKRNSGEPDVVLMGKEAFRAEVAEQGWNPCRPGCGPVVSRVCQPHRRLRRDSGHLCRDQTPGLPRCAQNPARREDGAWRESRGPGQSTGRSQGRRCLR